MLRTDVVSDELWALMPHHFGAWQSVAKRHLRWSKDGTHACVFAAVTADSRVTERRGPRRLPVGRFHGRARPSARSWRETRCPHRGLNRVARFLLTSPLTTRSPREPTNSPGAKRRVQPADDRLPSTQVTTATATWTAAVISDAGLSVPAGPLRSGDVASAPALLRDATVLEAKA